jgi:transposase
LVGVNGRGKVLAFFARQPACLVAMEACASAHYWAREIGKLGHTVRLIPPAYVKPFVKRQKNDTADAEAICDSSHEWHRQNEASRRLAAVPGIGVITATAIVATVSEPGQFRSGRQFAAWLGLVPKQNSSGDRQRLGGISKQGDRYLRRLLVVGATAVIRHNRGKTTPGAQWLQLLLEKKPVRLVSVALANKTARIAWALLARGQEFNPYRISAGGRLPAVTGEHTSW